MAIEITMPKMGLSMVTGTVVKWLKNEGEAISKGESVLEVMTDKLTNTVEAPGDGILLKIVAREEEELAVGGLLGVIGAAGESIACTGKQSTDDAAAPIQPPVVTGGRTKSSPLARKIAAEAGLAIHTLSGTGPAGRIVRVDVEKAIAARQAKEQQAAPLPQIAALPAFNQAEGQYITIPYTGMRKAIGDNMIRSRDTAVKVDYHGRADVSELLALRQTINASLEEKLTVTDMLVKIVAIALRKMPAVNVALSGDQIKMYHDVHVGVAVAIPNGLIVPVVRNADKKAVSQISREIKDLSQRAKENRLSPNEFQGGTFTISNLGAYRSVEFFTPIINQPEAAILGVGRTVDTPVAVNGEVIIRPLIGLSLVCDHRVLDGAPAAEFLALLINLIENPFSALI